MVAELGAPGIGAAGLSDVGAVVGATAPERLEELRELMPRDRVPAARASGAQGGRVEDLRPRSPRVRRAGWSRPRGESSTPTEKTGGDPAAAAADEAARLRELAWQLGG